MSKAKCREQPPAAPTAYQRPGKAAPEGTKLGGIFISRDFKTWAHFFDSSCCLQDLTELHKERQCLEKQHQQEVNKLNQELQQARTLYNSLQAQADKVNITVINKTKEKQSFFSSIRNYTYSLGFFSQLCYFLLCVSFLFPLLCFIPTFFLFVPKFEYISSLTL